MFSTFIVDLSQYYFLFCFKFLCFNLQSQGLNVTNITNPCGPEGNITVISYNDVFERPCTKYVPNLQITLPAEYDKVSVV